MDSLETLERFFDAENARDWGNWAACLHPEVTYEAVGSEWLVTGADAYVDHMKAAYADLLDWCFTARHSAAGESAVFVEFDGVGYYTGLYRSQDVVSVPLHLSAVCVFEFADGLIFRVREYLDRDGFDRQIEEFLARSSGM